MNTLRELLERMHPGAPWAALAIALRVFYRLASHPKVIALVGERQRYLITLFVTLVGTFWPELSSGDDSTSSAIVGLVLGLLASHDPPTKPPGASSDAPSSGPANTLRAAGGTAIVLLATSCSLPPARFTPEQEECRDTARMSQAAAFAQCLADDLEAEGACSDERLDAIEHDYCVALVDCGGDDGQKECDEN